MYEWQKLEHIFLINLQNIENENNKTHVYLLENDRNRDLRTTGNKSAENSNLLRQFLTHYTIFVSLHSLIVYSFMDPLSHSYLGAVLITLQAC